jgi:hypothetical protein
MITELKKRPGPRKGYTAIGKKENEKLVTVIAGTRSSVSRRLVILHDVPFSATGNQI